MRPVVATDGELRQLSGGRHPAASGSIDLRALAMQKIVGSSPIIHFPKALLTRSFRLSRVGESGWSGTVTEPQWRFAMPGENREPDLDIGLSAVRTSLGVCLHW